jgi:hypothetical protein
MAVTNPRDFMIEIGPMGPIGEGQALILRVNRNCPWNRCLFCPVYKGKKFSARNAEQVNADIDTISRIRNLVETTSQEVGPGGSRRKEIFQEVVRSHPDIYGEYPLRVTQEQWIALQSLNNVTNWLMYGAKRVFLQDANALLMKPQELTRVLRSLKDAFPTVETITCYARSKTCERRSAQELRELKDAGLSWCFVGIESGSDQVLGYMKKGVKTQEHIEGGQKIMEAGIRMAAFIMPGLAGRGRELAAEHISGTVSVLNEIQPSEVRVRSLAVLEDTPLYSKWESGEFQTASEDQMIEEIKMLLEGLTFNCTIETLQMTNSLFTIKGQLSAEREAMLKGISYYQDLPPLERARFLLQRYVDDGYLACVKSWGKYDTRLEGLIKEAANSIAEKSPSAMEKTDRALFAIKSKGVP